MFSSYYVSDVKWISNGSLFCSWTVRGHRKIVQTVTNVNKNFLTTEVCFFLEVNIFKKDLISVMWDYFLFLQINFFSFLIGVRVGKVG